MTAEGKELHALSWSVRRSIRYHTHRRAFFDRLNLLASAMGIIMGSAAVGTAIQKMAPEIVITLGVFTTVVSAVNLIVGSSKMARLHHDLVRQFSALEADCLKARGMPAEEIARLRCERLRIEAEEPPKLAVLDAMCHNELIIAEGRPSINLADVGFAQRILAPFMDYKAHELRTRKQKAEDAAPLAPPPATEPPAV